MRQTKVEFQLRVPLDAVSRDSPLLDALLLECHALSGVVDSNVDWRAKSPITAAPPLSGHVDVSFNIESETSKGLQKLYEQLTRKMQNDEVQMGGRSCSLTDMFA